MSKLACLLLILSVNCLIRTFQVLPQTALLVQEEEKEDPPRTAVQEGEEDLVVELQPIGQLPVTVQAVGNNVTRLLLESRPPRWIQERRNRHWIDHGAQELELPRRRKREECVPLGNWHEVHHPTCALFHEIDLVDGAQVIGSGAFRTAWRIQAYDGSKRVIKTVKLADKVVISPRYVDIQRKDTVAMEILTSSPYIANVYGYCASAQLLEYSIGADLYQVSRMNASKEVSLQVAHDVAAAVADAYLFDSKGRATMAHFDIKPEQFLLMGGRYKLNDFNLVRFFTWNNETKQHCEMYPEYNMTTVSKDAFSLGLVLYQLYTQSRLSTGSFWELVKAGKRPVLPSAVAEHPYDVAMRKALKLCWTVPPEGDPDVRKAVDLFRKALDEVNQGQGQSRNGGVSTR